jgi:hypothetical protein
VTQRRPGPSLAVSLVVLGIGIVLAVLGGAETALPLVRTLTHSTSHPTPARLHQHLSHGTYEIYQLTGDRSSAFSPVSPGSVDIGPGDVSVTSTGGEPVTVNVTREGADETLTLGDRVYTGAVQFAIPTAGDYVVSVTSDAPTRVILARSVGSIVRSVVGWIALAGAGGLLFLVGLVLLIVGLVRRSRRPVGYVGYAGAPGMALPPANWYADPSQPGQLRYWDGNQWTDQTHRP